MFCISCVSIFKYDHLIFQASIDSGSQSNLGWTAEPWNAMSWFYSPEYYMLCLTWLLYTLIPCSTFIVCIICVSCLCQSELAYTQTRVHSWLNTYIHHSFIDLCRVSFCNSTSAPSLNDLRDVLAWIYVCINTPYSTQWHLHVVVYWQWLTYVC